MSKIIKLLVLVIFLPSVLIAGVAAPGPVKLTQSDGTVFWAEAKGNEYVHWMETLNGYTIILYKSDWYYAQQDEDGRLVPTDLKVVGQSANVGEEEPVDLNLPPGIMKHLRPPVDRSLFEKHTPRKLRKPTKKTSKSNVQIQAILADQSSIYQPLLVLAVSFSDRIMETSASAITAQFFGATESVKEFFLDNSYNNFVVTAAAESQGVADDGVISVSLAYSHPDFGNEYSDPARLEIVADALNAADSAIDFSSYDSDENGDISAAELGVVLIVAGYEKATGGDGASHPNVWAHQGSMQPGVTLDGVRLSSYAMLGEIQYDHPATIGVMVHELSHLVLGLPDLYDRDGSSAGIGKWGLMAQGCWNFVSLLGDSPAALSAWSKEQVGFLFPLDITTVISRL